jgi:alkylated DNA repair dioxygenase AlkB
MTSLKRKTADFGDAEQESAKKQKVGSEEKDARVSGKRRVLQGDPDVAALEVVEFSGPVPSLPTNLADRMQASLKALPRKAWTHNTIGKNTTRRGHAAFGRGTYRFSNTTVAASPLKTIDGLGEFVEWANQTWGCEFDFALAAWYPDQRTAKPTSLMWHADDEPFIKPNSTIVAVSMGAPQRIKGRPNSDRTQVVELVTEHGQVYAMTREYQSRYQHCAVPLTKKQRKALEATPGHVMCGERFSITLRQGNLDAI